MKKGTSITIGGILFCIIILMILNSTSKIDLEAQYKDEKILVKYDLPNLDEVEKVYLTSRYYYLENYVNVLPIEETYVLESSASEYMLNVDTSMFLGMQDLIELQIDVEYKNGKQISKTIKYRNFSTNMIKDAVIPFEVKGDYSLFHFEGITIKIQTNKIEEDFIIFKDLMNPKERFNIGFKYNNYLYPLKKYSVILRENEKELDGVVVPFTNDSISSNLILIDIPTIENPWLGLYPYDDDGNLVSFKNPELRDGLLFSDENIQSELIPISEEKFASKYQSIPKIEFYNDYIE